MLKRIFNSAHRLLLTMLLLTAVPVQAQHQPELGVSAGIGTGRLYNALTVGQGGFRYGPTPVFGIHMSISLLDKLDAVAEINYLQINTVKEDLPVSGEAATRTPLRLDYLEVPLLIRRYLGAVREQPLRVYVCFGPFISKLLLSDQAYAESSLSLRSFDWGVSQGVGLSLRLRQVRIWIDGRYNMGLLNTRDNGSGTLKTDLFTIRTGICFIFP